MIKFWLNSATQAFETQLVFEAKIFEIQSTVMVKATTFLFFGEKVPNEDVNYVYLDIIVFDLVRKIKTNTQQYS